MILRLLIIMVFLISNTNCIFFQSKKDDNNDLLILLGFIQPLGDYWARLYKIRPEIIYDPTNIDLIYEPHPSEVDLLKKKIILITGWDYTDRSNRSYPSSEELKDRALNKNLGHIVSSFQFSILVSQYEIYTFDYLTSDPVDVNGLRLRNRMDQLFSSSYANVIIYAHSMGGLVSRFAIYTGERPNYMKAVITNGTPFHGSPWASPEYQKDKLVLGQLASFFTDTEGGKDLRWDNYDFSLSGASNFKLLHINSLTNRDDLFHTLYGEVPSGTSYASDSQKTFFGFCYVLNDFSNHDCIVPSRSAYLDGNTPAYRQKIGNYDHNDINWNTNTVRNYLLNYINNL